MHAYRRSAFLLTSIFSISLAALAVPRTAHAEEVVVIARTPRHRERIVYVYDEREKPMALYPVEIEPHFAFGPDNVYGNAGLGGGARISIPLVAAVFGPRFSDNFAVSFGADVLHYDNCYYSTRCSANYLMVPVAAQWNLFFGRHASLFGELGGFVYRGFFDECRSADVGCTAPRDLGILPTIAIGGRLHVGENFAFVGRLGYPTSTLGVSFL